MTAELQLPTADKKNNLLDLDRASMEALFAEMGEKPFRAKQLMKWMYHSGVTDFAEMTDLSKALRAKLNEHAEIRGAVQAIAQNSNDGTRKWLIRLPDGQAVETVFIPEANRGTLCISSQVGCTLDCRFCSTGQQGFNRNLTTAEIIGQVWSAHKTLVAEGSWGDRPVSNIVFMGMGEPLTNLKQVLPAIDILLDDFGFGLSKRRVTVSTAGVVPAIDKLREFADVALAVSLHAPNDKLRDEIVPINQKYPIAELLAACHRYVKAQSRRMTITWEYVMLDGVNDSDEHAHELATLLKDIPSKVNLIPFNPFPGTKYERSPEDRILRFNHILWKRGIITTTRRTRGEDIDAACGQLVGNVADRSRRVEKRESAEAAASASVQPLKRMDIRA